MDEKKEVDVLSKKRPTVNELKTEVIRLRESNKVSNGNINHYKTMYENICEEAKNLRSLISRLNSSKNQLEANNKNLSNINNALKEQLNIVNKNYKEVESKRKYNTIGFIVASIIAFTAIAVIVLRLV